MKALATGAAGVIGSRVARSLLEKGLEVVALDDLSGGVRDNAPPVAKWVQASVADYPALQCLFEAANAARPPGLDGKRPGGTH